MAKTKITPTKNMATDTDPEEGTPPDTDTAPEEGTTPEEGAAPQEGTASDTENQVEVTIRVQGNGWIKFTAADRMEAEKQFLGMSVSDLPDNIFKWETVKETPVDN